MLHCMRVSEAACRDICFPEAENWFVHESGNEKRFIAYKQAANFNLVQNSQNSRGKGEEVWMTKSRSCNCSLKYLGLVAVEVEVFV